MHHPLKYPDWLTRRRVAQLATILAVISIAALFYRFATVSGIYDYKGLLIGGDYSAFWSSGRMALEGRAGDAYDLKMQFEHLSTALNDPDAPKIAWLHPPIFFLVVTPLSAMPYTISVYCWLLMGGTLYLSLIWHLDKSWLALALGVSFPVALINVSAVQTGLIFCALYGFAMLSIARRPGLAGFLIGLMAIKPHLCIMIPFVLWFSGHYRVFVSATITVIGLCIATSLVFGPEIWTDFLRGTHVSRSLILESGGVDWYKLQSAFTILRTWGGSVIVAYSVQICIALAVTVSTIWIWRSQADPSLKSAAMMTGACLVTPYILDYDLVILAPALGWMCLYGCRRGFLAYEQAGMACIWLVASFMRSWGEEYSIPVGLMMSSGLYLLIIRRVWHEVRTVRLTAPTPAII